MEHKFDADLATPNQVSALGVKRPREQEPSKVKPEVNAPVIPTVENTTMVQRRRLLYSWTGGLHERADWRRRTK
jgi:hypothetical protein